MMLGKALSTTQRLVGGIDAGIAKAGADFAGTSLFLHGSTIAINTMLERTGAKTALITTEGFRDSYEIGRVNRPDAYNLYFQKHEPLVERALRFEVRERIYADGSVRTPLDEDAVARLAETLTTLGIEAVAILFLHSYRNPAHEARAKEILLARNPGLFVSASHELSQEYREFERASTVVANAYVGPRVRSYVKDIVDHTKTAGFKGTFLVVQSTGGLYGAHEAQIECIRMLESGPAAGVIGAQALCQALGLDDAISIDMGGTTAKAGVIYDGEALATGSVLVGGYERALPVQITMLDIFEVGTGGGSIARVGEGGALRVGPLSAGAEPGPACYGLGGTEPTVTDANLVLGRLGADRFLGGEMTLDLGAAERALRDKIAAPLGLDLGAAADGVVRIAVNSMAHAVRSVTASRGFDAGNFTLVAYGGAGPLHASAVAREIGIRRVIVPRAPGHFSAFGMLFSDLRHDYVRTWFTPLDEAPLDEIERLYRAMEDQGHAAIRHSAIAPSRVVVARAADMRYVGQEHAVTVDLPTALFAKKDRAGIKRRFDEVHEIRYGTSAPKERAEIVSLRSSVTGLLSKPRLERIAKGAAAPGRGASAGRRAVLFAADRRPHPTPCYVRDRLVAGNRIRGPALIEEHASTTVVEPGDTLLVDPFGNLVISVGGNRA